MARGSVATVRSINKAGTARFYSCRAPNALAVQASDRGSATKVDERATPAQRAQVALKGGAVYRSSAAGLSSSSS